jgi:hypothetical protein
MAMATPATVRPVLTCLRMRFLAARLNIFKSPPA